GDGVYAPDVVCYREVPLPEEVRGALRKPAVAADLNGDGLLDIAGHTFDNDASPKERLVVLHGSAGGHDFVLGGQVAIDSLSSWAQIFAGQFEPGRFELVRMTGQ